MAGRSDLPALVRRHAIELAGNAGLERLVEQIGDASVVLLGEASHGTHEFYRLRAQITRRLIAVKGFDAVAVEADWPDALRVSRYLQGASDDGNVEAALRGFERFPRWMWRNAEVVEFLRWLRSHNDTLDDPSERIGFWGLDLYSLRGSMDAVVRYLERADPDGARRARERYACFDHLADDPQRYGYAATFGMRDDCEREVLQQLRELCRGSPQGLRHDGMAEADELFYAQQNARVVRNAEAYYRTMFQGRSDSWNLRDTHMAETLEALQAHLQSRRGRPPRIVVWAHNSHLGDARATDWAEQGQLNLGQLVRERLPQNSFLLGFTTHTGTVAAASDWDAPVERKQVLESRPGSIERVMHDSGAERFALPLRGDAALVEALDQPLLQRAIGVIYRPDTELMSHYFRARVSAQFDALIHVDDSRSVRPLDRSGRWQHSPETETYPSGM
ncbi:erythromycin esterase family protein [Aquabacterium sp. A7-Y]|uniref:erythromycin esterase family protein n=1 Tax=Aquabacterium sp. A7-Y TaxID=1349605 RepID=UPI00223CDE9E|nr:erythromycin esterase family protein [Aquabacterium sp. A7-Y]MCW7539240.1 erythromycin esterase family protein [Aquabacterium sp. A7-Y]